MDGVPPWLSEIVEASLAPHRGVVADDELGWMREQLIERLTSDPELARLARDAAPRIPTEESGRAEQRDVFASLTDEARASLATRRT